MTDSLATEQAEAVPDPMDAEFDTVAEWTAQAARELGEDYYVPAGCRGTGHPAAFDWLLDRMDASDSALVDIGAGVGGSAAYAAQHVGCRPMLLEPAAGACRAARRLFGYPTVRADAAALPLPTGVVRNAWSLGVLCTTPDQSRVLRELRRVLAADGRAGLLVFVSSVPEPTGEPDGNHFPTLPELHGLLADAELIVVDELPQSELPPEPDEWRARADAVYERMQQRHGSNPAWQVAEEESGAVGRLLRKGIVSGELLVVAPTH